VRVLDLGAVFRRRADGADLGFDADPGRSGDPDRVTGELQVLPQWEGGTLDHGAGVASRMNSTTLSKLGLWSRWRPATTLRLRTKEEINATMFWFPALADSTGCTP
jgi:hypothetical protein